jgi:hypothetical protein
MSNKLTVCRLADPVAVRSGRLSVLSDDVSDDIRKTPARSLRNPFGKLSLQSGLSCGCVHNATKILKLHPYHVHVTNELKEPDRENDFSVQIVYSLYSKGYRHFR